MHLENGLVQIPTYVDGERRGVPSADPHKAPVTLFRKIRKGTKSQNHEAAKSRTLLLVFAWTCDILRPTLAALNWSCNDKCIEKCMWSDLRPDKQTRDAHTPAIASCYVHNARPFWRRLDGFWGSSSGETWRTVAPIGAVSSTVHRSLYLQSRGGRLGRARGRYTPDLLSQMK